MTQNPKDFDAIRPGCVVVLEVPSVARRAPFTIIPCVSPDLRQFLLPDGKPYTFDRKVWEACGGHIVSWPEEASVETEQMRESFCGYLFHNPDTGTEWNISHPVESGECEDATDIQHATFPRLISQMQEAWRALEENEAERQQDIKSAEARGAAEQRRKDVEGQEPAGYVPADTPNFFAISEAKHASTALHRKPFPNDVPVYYRPANVAALEAEFAALKEAEQLARADAEASKAREETLKAEVADKGLAAVHLLAVLHRPDLTKTQKIEAAKRQLDAQFITGELRGALTREGGV
ncbi:hypothetical protein JK202_01720 [Gluconobacter sp. Dm-62]|uniref:hypothetical protein n=1 Tax=Gluconobacter sp. Dm-62 TaxID=2799804 RepID=UPI001B8B3123|nr:hypothetical protein [Gluconobacter sp. Dm-62]MBS1101745.1 hypothetical protein [Gluconobacter sp. Dm-62]